MFVCEEVCVFYKFVLFSHVVLMIRCQTFTLFLVLCVFGLQNVHPGQYLVWITEGLVRCCDFLILVVIMKR